MNRPNLREINCECCDNCYFSKIVSIEEIGKAYLVCNYENNEKDCCLKHKQEWAEENETFSYFICDLWSI
jgi:hypothetical protein